MKKTALVFMFALALGGAAQAKDCVKGKACGETCIAQDAVCKTEASAPSKNCKKGKACGNSCIPKNAVCHK